LGAISVDAPKKPSPGKAGYFFGFSGLNDRSGVHVLAEMHGVSMQLLAQARAGGWVARMP